MLPILSAGIQIFKPGANVHHRVGRETDMDRVTGETLLIEAASDSRKIHAILLRPSWFAFSPSQTCKEMLLLHHGFTLRMLLDDVSQISHLLL